MASYSELQPVSDFDSWETKAPTPSEDFSVNSFENDFYGMSTLFEYDFSPSKSRLEDDGINPHMQIADAFGNMLSKLHSDDVAVNEQDTAESEVIPHYYTDDRIVQPGFYLRLPQIYQNTVRTFGPISPAHCSETDVDSIYHEAHQDISKEISREFPPSVSLEVSENTAKGSDRLYPRPPMSFQFLIILAIKSEKCKMCTTRQIYKFITANFPYFRTAEKGWQNCVRHTLSTFKNKTLDKYKGQGCYQWSIKPRKAEETNEKLKKAWNKDVQRIKASTINPNYIEELVNASTSQFVSQDLSRPSVSLEDQLHQEYFEPWFVSDPFSFTLEDQETSLVDHKSLPVDHNSLPVDPLSSVFDQEMPPTDHNSFVLAENQCSMVVGTEVSFMSPKPTNKQRKRRFSHEKNDTPAKPMAKKPRLNENGRLHMRPGLSFTHLVTIALKNSPTGSLKVKEIYNFVSQHFPFFDINEPAGWKNSLRHALCQKQYFCSWENPISEDSRGKHSRLYSLRPEMRQQLIQFAKNACQIKEDQVKEAMENPENLWDLI